MDYKILMLGGRRSGKTTLLASILQQLRKIQPILSILDKTNYTQNIMGKEGLKFLPTLDVKRYELEDLILSQSFNREFLVDMSPPYGKSSYLIEVRSNDAVINLEFINVPGEWMSPIVQEYSYLIDLIKQCDIFVIAIDTPFLMNAVNSETVIINNVYNRIREITDALLNINIESHGIDLKRIILCPVKCEKWVRYGKADEVLHKVKEAYSSLIERYKDIPEVSIEVMPVQTAGGIESSRLLPAKLYFKNNDDIIGTVCSEDPDTRLLIRGDGRIFRRRAGSFIDEDICMIVDHVRIPLSWFRINGSGYSPKYCDQLVYHILKFLIEKEVCMAKANNNNVLFPFLTPFLNQQQQYVPIWLNVIKELDELNLIKYQGDGFEIIKR